MNHQSVKKNSSLDSLWLKFCLVLWGPDIMPVTLRHAQGADVLLRSRPDNRAPLTDVLIKYGEEVQMTTWKLDEGADDFVHVFCDRGHGWIRLRHLLIQWDAQIYKRLTDNEWFGHHWMIHADKCSIRVSRGSYDQQELETNIQEMGHELALKKYKKTIAQMVEEGYTYVSLELGRPFNSQRMENVSNCHITIAYAACMTDMKKASFIPAPSIFCTLGETLSQK